MLKKIVCIMGAVAIFILAVGCSSEPQKPKLGVSFGVGGATRWVKEKQFMEDRAKELGADITVRFNTTDFARVSVGIDDYFCRIGRFAYGELCAVQTGRRRQSSAESFE